VQTPDECVWVVHQDCHGISLPEGTRLPDFVEDGYRVDPTAYIKRKRNLGVIIEIMEETERPVHRDQAGNRPPPPHLNEAERTSLFSGG